MTKHDRLFKRFTKALDRAIASKTPMDQDPWCRVWTRAYRREIYRLAHR
jgi:hypothetical protein